MNRQRIDFKIVKIVCGMFLIFLLFCLIKSFRLQSSISRYKMLDGYLDDNRGSNDTKYILFWTKYFLEKNWGMKTETYYEDYLKSIKCPVTNCVFTNNKNLLSHVHEYDALVFHGAESRMLVELPRTRSPHQIYIMGTKESPGEIKYDLELDDEFYNLTMSYRLDSDINWYYGIAIDRESGRTVAPALNVQWRIPDNDFNDNELLHLVKNKQKTAAWFVSHCNVFSKRELLVKSLQEFIDVDVYGKCGTLSCRRLSSECDEMLNSTYRFYFAFENTLCIDYLTEKLYNTINSYVIPVIYTGADISRFLPPKSYIDANDFKNAEDLANHLKFLSGNPEEYVKYFWWKKHYRIIRSDDLEYCEMCQKLNQPNFIVKKQIYVSIKEWFYRNACKTTSIKF